MNKWQELQARLMEIVIKGGGPEKFSDGTISVHFDADGVSVDMGTYSVADWPRHTLIGPCPTEEEAYKATEQQVNEADKSVADELTADELDEEEFDEEDDEDE